MLLRRTVLQGNPWLHEKSCEYTLHALPGRAIPGPKGKVSQQVQYTGIGKSARSGREERGAGTAGTWESLISAKRTG